MEPTASEVGYARRVKYLGSGPRVRLLIGLIKRDLGKPARATVGGRGKGREVWALSES